MFAYMFVCVRAWRLSERDNEEQLHTSDCKNWLRGCTSLVLVGLILCRRQHRTKFNKCKINETHEIVTYFLEFSLMTILLGFLKTIFVLPNL